MSWTAATSIFEDCMCSAAHAFFVTRAKSNMKYHRLYSRPVDKSAGILADQSVVLDGFYTSRDYPEHTAGI